MPDSFDTPSDAIFYLAQELKDLEQRANVVYEPIVNAIISSRCTDVRQIEQTLDGCSTSQEAMAAFDSSSRFASTIGRSIKRRLRATFTATVTSGTTRNLTLHNRITPRLSDDSLTPFPQVIRRNRTRAITQTRESRGVSRGVGPTQLI
jgi:hypothetical protein